MDELSAFEAELQDALRHLYDSRYVPPDRLCLWLGLESREGQALCDYLLKEIASLEPSLNVPPTSPRRFLYQVLELRYLRNLTQEATAERLGITPRHLRRRQREAISILARHIWESQQAVPESKHAAIADEAGLASDWQAQVRAELRALEQRGLAAESDVGEALQSLLTVAEALTSDSKVHVTLETVEPDMVVNMPAPGLRRVLIAALARLVRQIPTGSVEISARRQGARIEIVVVGDPVGEMDLEPGELAVHILAEYGGEMQARVENGRATIRVLLNPAGTIKVLVVDDNESLVHFYRRFVSGTRYVIEHLGEGSHLLERLPEIMPDIIVLDIMLPDVDGWELLTYLHASPDATRIPVLVCSVVRDHELALSLGASHCVAKPIGRQAFIQALDTVAARVAGDSAIPSASNATAC